MRKTLFIFTILLLLGSGYAQDVSKVGTAGCQFLKIGVDPRGVAMGEAFTALTTGVPSLYWNPAGLAVTDGQQFVVSDVEWFADIRTNFLGYSRPMGGIGTLGMGLTALTMAEEEITEVANPEGTGYYWGANSFALSLSYGRQLTTEFAFGITGKLLAERIWDVSSTGFAVDFGALLYPQVAKGLRLGLAITNFGPDMQFRGGQLDEEVFREDWAELTGPMEVGITSMPYSLPLTIRLGIVYELANTPSNWLVTALELSHPKDGPEKVHIGAEYGYKNTLFLRAGYKYDRYMYDYKESNTDGFSLGAGIRYAMNGAAYKVDYAMINKGYLGWQPLFSLGLEF
jgi:hypothetical protein